MTKVRVFRAELDFGLVSQVKEEFQRPEFWEKRLDELAWRVSKRLPLFDLPLPGDDDYEATLKLARSGKFSKQLGV